MNSFLFVSPNWPASAQREQIFIAGAIFMILIIELKHFVKVIGPVEVLLAVWAMNTASLKDEIAVCCFVFR